MIEAKLILIKEYKEFAEEISLEGITDEQGISEKMIVAREVEAIILLNEEVTFSIGFSVTRENNLFEIKDPRDLVRKFLETNFS